MQKRLATILALTFLLSVSTAQAVLIDITGTAGAGEITISFSGSSTVDTGVTFAVDDDDGFVDNGWILPSSFFVLGSDISGLDLTSSTGTIFDGSTTYDILQVAVRPFSAYLGFGIDDPREVDSLIGRIYNRFVFANLFLDVTDHLRTGLEVSHWRTGYHNRTTEPGFNPTDDPDQPGKATVVHWTVQYWF